MLKIIGGKYRSRILLVPSNSIPTKGAVREAISSALSDIIDGANVLDAFAGSGALGIEMLSRGAKKALFLDDSGEAIYCLDKNLSTLKESRGQVLHMDAISYLRRTNEKFDIIFLDPPYGRIDLYEDSLLYIKEKGLLNPGGALVIEYEEDFPMTFDEFARVKDYHYGRTKVTIAWK